MPDGPVLPLDPDDPSWVRKGRVAELRELWLRCGCHAPLMYFLLKRRYRTPPSGAA
jgi:hypothetical protein